MAALAILEVNGRIIDVEPDVVADLVLAVAAGTATRYEVVAFLRANARPLTSDG